MVAIALERWGRGVRVKKGDCDEWGGGGGGGGGGGEGGRGSITGQKKGGCVVVIER